MNHVNKRYNLLNCLFLIFISASLNIASATTNTLSLNTKDKKVKTLDFDSIYIPISSNNTSLNALPYQAFTIPKNNSATFKYLIWNFYGNNDCTTLLESVQIGQEDQPSKLGPDTYIADDFANYQICSHLPSGCNLEISYTQSVQVSYMYMNGKSVLGQCYNGNGGDRLIDFEGNKLSNQNFSFQNLYMPDMISLWTNIGNAGFTGGLAEYTSLALNESGTPYVAYSDYNNSGKAIVKTFDGTSWVNVGSGNVNSRKNALYTSLAIDKSGTPYLAFEDGYNGFASVTKFINGKWVYVGKMGFSSGVAKFTSLAINESGTPYVAYMDNTKGYKATVMKFNGVSWELVGNPGFSASNYGVVYTSLAISESGTPYLAYEDGPNGGPARVMKFNGTAWESVGANGGLVSGGAASYISLAINKNGIPYVAYQDGVNKSKVTVMKFNGESWVAVGNPGISAGQVEYPNLAISESGTPYIAFADFINNSIVTVMKFNGKTWVDVGTGAVGTDENTSYTSLAINKNGIPYVAYENGINTGPASAVKFNGE